MRSREPTSYQQLSALVLGLLSGLRRSVCCPSATHSSGSVILSPSISKANLRQTARRTPVADMWTRVTRQPLKYVEEEPSMSV